MKLTDTLALAAQGDAPPAGGGNELLFPMLAAIALLFYFLILRPQRREQQKSVQMRESLSKGDRVKSIGGIYGVVTSVDTTRGVVKVKVDKNVELEFDKGAIATVIRKDEERNTGESVTLSK